MAGIEDLDGWSRITVKELLSDHAYRPRLDGIFARIPSSLDPLSSLDEIGDIYFRTPTPSPFSAESAHSLLELLPKEKQDFLRHQALARVLKFVGQIIRSPDQECGELRLKEAEVVKGYWRFFSQLDFNASSPSEFTFFPTFTLFECPTAQYDTSCIERPLRPLPIVSNKKEIPNDLLKHMVAHDGSLEGKISPTKLKSNIIFQSFLEFPGRIVQCR